jgi:uncharacterized membrane protein
MDKKLYWGAIAASLVGVAVSIYLTIYKLTDNNAMCLGSGDCSIVNASRYSEVYGIPVAIIGIIGYLAILVVLLLETRLTPLIDIGNLLAFGMSLVGLLFSAYLTYLELYVIKATCPFCFTSAIAITIIFIFTLIRLARNEAEK